MDSPINKSEMSVSTIKEVQLCANCGISETLGETSMEVQICDSDSWDECIEEQTNLENDSGIVKTPLNNEILSLMEKRINDLHDMIVEQNKILATIKEDMKASKTFIENLENAHITIVEDVFKKILAERVQELVQLEKTEPQGGAPISGITDHATTLLNAIELETDFSIDRGIRDALKNLLQSDELKEKLVSATVSAVEEMVAKVLSKDFAEVYTPMLEKMQWRLQNRVIMILEECFNEIEENTKKYIWSLNKATKRNQMKERFYWLAEFSNIKKRIYKTVRNTVTQVLENEMAQWHSNLNRVITELYEQMQIASHVDQKNTSAFPTVIPTSLVHKSLHQPIKEEDTIVDQLMKSATLIKQLEKGEVNEAFWNALQARELRLVIAVCKAADPAKVFGEPCLIEEPILLSLAQQLSTDLIHDTQLKCRYLESAVKHLIKMETAARQYLPLVAKEVSNNLAKFFETYPYHVASPQIRMIFVTINKITKYPKTL